MDPKGQAIGRLRALDGLRAIAVISVLIGHGIATAHAPQSIYAAAVFLGNCDLGVDLFFVLSGYLITTQLVRERERTGTIDVAGFYLRRARRILPAFYVWLLVVAGLVASHRLIVPERELAAAAVFLYNDLHGPFHWWIANVWTLCIEQQFYLAFPLLVLVCTPRRRAALLIAIVVLEPVLRAVAWHAIGEHVRPILYETQFNLDPLADGCILALLLRDEAVRRRLRTATARWITLGAIGVAAIAVPTIEVFEHLGFYFLFGITLYGASGAIVIAHIVVNEEAMLSRALRFGPLLSLGAISYSLYLWQQLFMTTSSPIGFPLNVLVAIAVASASYRFVERPALGRLRRGESLGRANGKIVPEAVAAPS